MPRYHSRKEQRLKKNISTTNDNDETADNPDEEINNNNRKNFRFGRFCCTISIGVVTSLIFLVNEYSDSRELKSFLEIAGGTTTTTTTTTTSTIFDFVQNTLSPFLIPLALLGGMIVLICSLVSALTFQSACWTVVSAVILHIPGLYCRIQYQQDVLGSFLGSITEGVFLLVLFTKSFTYILNNCGKNDTGNILMVVILVFMTIPLLIFSVASSIGDYTFQNITGGAIPDMWALAAGYADAKAHLTAFRDDDGSILKIISFVVCFGVAFSVHGFGLVRNHPTTAGTSSNMSISNWLLLTTMLVALVTYQIGLWQPIMHASLSLVGSYIFTIETVQVQKAIQVDQTNLSQPNRKRPNVLYLMHEGTSGAYWLNKKQAAAQTPFFQSLMKDDDMYVFEYARSVSGDTCDAMTVLVTGCLPIDHTAQQFAFRRSIATEFKQQGYQTASFSSRLIGMLKVTKWYMLINYLRDGNLDVPTDPESANLTLIEPRFPSTDDRIMARYFANWTNHRTSADPYFAMFYTYNTHWPWLHKFGVEGVQRYYDSFETLDEALKIIFDHLNNTNQLDNTIIIGSADHGEAFEAKVSRLTTWNPYALQTLTYMYVPKGLITPEERATLRHNTKKAVSTLDMFQTAQHFAYGGNAQDTMDLRNRSNAADATSEFESQKCITGLDLLDVKIPEERVTISWNYISIPFEGMLFMSAVSTRDRGLFVFGPPRKIEYREMMFGECTKSPVQSDAWYHQCTRDVTDDDLVYWKEVLSHRGDNTTTMINDAGQKGYYMEAILKKLDMM